MKKAKPVLLLTASQNSPYTFLTTEQLRSLPLTKWRVKGLFPDKGLASIYGPSGSGKSFLALDLMAAIVRGTSFYGSKTNPCSVVYVALEGTGGIARRIEAYETHHNITFPRTFRVVTDMLSLFNSEAKIFAAAINEEGLNEGVIVIDTLAQSAPGSDENSSADMGRIISNAQLLQRETNGLVVLIHHTGKDASRGARGHSSLFASLDAAIEVKRPASGREWHRAKVKDGEDGVTTPFRLEHVVLGTDEDGDEISSCVAVGDLFRATQPKTPSGKNQIAVYDALAHEFKSGETASKADVQKIAEGALSNNPKFRTRAKDALASLVEMGHLTESNDGYHIA
jgi:putative DNA primase/helicase